MRGHLNIAGQTARPNTRIDDVRNPELLRSKDLDAYQIVRDYRTFLDLGAGEKRAATKAANPDLLPYFKYVEREYIKEHATGRVDATEPAV